MSHTIDDSFSIQSNFYQKRPFSKWRRNDSFRFQSLLLSDPGTIRNKFDFFDFFPVSEKKSSLEIGGKFLTALRFTPYKLQQIRGGACKD